MARPDFVREPKEYEERIIQIKRVSKKTIGGNKIGFTALVVIGDRKGKIGFALGKSRNVASAIQKGLQKAKEEVIKVDIDGSTIPHEVLVKFKGSKLLLKPAPKGSGIIAGGTVREVIELAGISDVSAKMLGSKNKHSNIRCTFEALKLLRTKHPEEEKDEAK